jgi:hypothetical protein
MDKIFIAYNYYTLGKALSLIRNNESIGDNTIIYYAKDTHPFNNKIRSACKIILIRYGNEIAKMKDGDFILQFPKFSIIQILANWINSNLLGRKILYVVKNTIKETPSILYVFKDNHSGEASAIEWTKKNRKLCVNILIEEGLALYTRKSSEPQRIKYYHIKRVISFLLGTSAYPIFNLPQGRHPAVQEILCSNDNVLQKSELYNDKTIRKAENFYNKEFSSYFCSLVLGSSIDKFLFRDYDYIFLTQALVENDIIDFNKYIETLKSIIDIIAKYGKVLIKAHPRELIDYHKIFNCEKIYICPNILNSLPFQALFPLLQNPKILTFYSAIGNDIKTFQKIIYTYPLLNCENLNKSLDNIFINDENVRVIYNLEELEKILKSSIS